VVIDARMGRRWAFEKELLLRMLADRRGFARSFHPSLDHEVLDSHHPEPLQPPRARLEIIAVGVERLASEDVVDQNGEKLRDSIRKELWDLIGYVLRVARWTSLENNLEWPNPELPCDRDLLLRELDER